MRWPWQRLLTRGELGALGERHAARLLRARGLQVLEANFRTKQGELDLVARERDTLVFVEVRTRTAEAITSPLATVDAHKQAQLLRMARIYRRARRLPDTPTRFDVVEVIATPHGRVVDIRHVVGAFGEDG